MLLVLEPFRDHWLIGLVGDLLGTVTELFAVEALADELENWRIGFRIIGSLGLQNPHTHRENENQKCCHCIPDETPVGVSHRKRQLIRLLITRIDYL